MKNDYQIKKAYFLDLFKAEQTFIESSDRFYTFIDLLLKDNWTRGDVYYFIHDIFENYSTILSESLLNIMNEFDTSITGFCDISCIAVFEGDPVDKEELASYVRSNIWKQ